MRTFVCYTDRVVCEQAASHTVNVHCLRSQADGGILDKDDFVCDVAADKDQVDSTDSCVSSFFIC